MDAVLLHKLTSHDKPHGQPNSPDDFNLRKRERDLPIGALKAIRMLAEVVRLKFRGEVF